MSLTLLHEVIRVGHGNNTRLLAGRANGRVNITELIGLQRVHETIVCEIIAWKE